jgi:hypothetical protein
VGEKEMLNQVQHDKISFFKAEAEGNSFPFAKPPAGRQGKDGRTSNILIQGERYVRILL